VWQRLIWTDTYNHFLTPDELAESIDEDPREIKRILAVGRFFGLGADLFLRAHGIISRPYYGRLNWCLLGIGPIYLTFSASHLAHAMTAELNGIQL